MLKKNWKNVFPRKTYFIIFMLVLGFAIFLRFYNLDWETFSFDEIVFLKAANEFLKGNFIYNFYGFDTPPLMMKYFYAIQLTLFGISTVAIRLISATFGILTCILLFYFVKKFYDAETALTALMLTSFSLIHLQFSRLAVLETTVGFFFLLAIYLFYDMVENKRKRCLFLGIALGLGMLTKYIMLYCIVAIIVYSLLKDYISVRIKPRLSLSIDNTLVKSFLVGILVFFVLWPFALYPMRTEINAYIHHDGEHGGEFTVSIPTLLLTFGNVGSLAIGERKGVSWGETGILQMPVIGYFSLFMTKESILYVVLFFTGLFAILRNPKPLDKFILLTILIFFLLLWLQSYGYTYRYITVIIPLLSIIVARSISLIKTDNIKLFIIIFLGMFLGFYSFFASPSYALHYNSLNELLNIPESEARYSEGMREAINYTMNNCNSLLTDRLYVYMIEYHVQNFATNNASSIKMPTCVMKGIAKSDLETIDNFMNTHSCNIKKEIYKKDIHLFDIFECE